MEHSLQLEKLYSTWKNSSPDRIKQLNNTSASPRLYFRIYAENDTFIGVYNTDIKENRAFFHFSQTFKKGGLHVPTLYFVSENETYYLLEDLGDTNLLDLLKEEGESDSVKYLYTKAIDELLKMQLFGRNQIDFKNFSYPRADFDAQSVLWDLNYFKYYFLKVSGLTIDEQLLENDFHAIAKEVGKQKWIAFMYRDFQARNIQILKDDIWFIDYQGGRKGPMLYDLASLLYQASAQLSLPFREELKAHYKKRLGQEFSVDNKTFEQDFNLMAFMRIIQTLGAYGFRGLIEKKAYFVESIPLALENLENLIQSQHLKLEIPYFIDILSRLYQLKSKFVRNNI